MMPNLEGTKTLHQLRSEQVRERCKKVLAKIEKPKRRGGFTIYGAFVEIAWRIAVERGIQLSKQKDTTVAGVPKDLVTSFKLFIAGERTGWERNLAVYELACIEFEEQFRLARQEARAGLTLVAGSLDSPEAVTELPVASQEDAFEPDEPALPELDEFDAMRMVVDTLSGFTEVQRRRIVAAACTHYSINARFEEFHGA